MKSQTQNEIHVCVLGAGVCGIVAVKACLEAGLKVTCYEKSGSFGGLWNYTDDKDGAFRPSVMRTTILNTSKELSAFSDFPPPGHLPNFMKHHLYMDYIRSYVEHFDVQPHIRFQHEVTRCEPKLLNKQTGEVEWIVEGRDTRKNISFSNRFDKLMVAIGHHNIPFVPTFPGQHNFQGSIKHSAHLKDIIGDEKLANKNVLVVGFGNSACDAACDLALVTNKCYVSSHRGNWFLGRLALTGPYELEDKNKWTRVKSQLLPRSLLDRMKIDKLESRLNHRMLGLTPKHKPSEHIPIINDLFPYRVFTGGITLKGPVSQFTKDGVQFKGEENQEYQIDTVIFATGYTAKVSFFDEFALGIKSVKSNEYELYLNMFAPNLSVQDLDGPSFSAVQSLAFIGLLQPSGSITVISELQSRLAALVFNGKCHLPSLKEMEAWINLEKAKRSSAIRSHSKDQLVNWVDYSDEIARLMGVKPNMSKLFFKDFTLWRRLMFGPSVSYQFRLFGPGRWNKARETILKVDERIHEGINDGKNYMLFQSRLKRLEG